MTEPSSFGQIPEGDSRIDRLHSTPDIEEQELIPTSPEEKDTIEKSQKDLAGLYYLLLNLIAGFPQLESPEFKNGDENMTIEEASRELVSRLGVGGGGSLSETQVTAVTELLLEANEKMAKLGTDILNKWSENIKKIDREIQERIRSLSYQAEQQQTNPNYIAKMQEVNPSVQAIEKDKQLNLSIDAMFAKTNDRIDALNKTDPEILLTVPVLAAAMMIVIPVGIETGLRVADQVETVGKTSLLETTSVAEKTFVETSQQIFPNMVDPSVLSQLGALMAAPLFQTVWAEGVKAAGSKNAPDLMNHALRFSREVLKMVSKEGVVETFLAPYLKNLPIEKTADPNILTREQFVAVNKLLLGLIALALLIKAKKGNKDFKDTDFEELSQLLQSMKKDATQGKKIDDIKGLDDTTRSLLVLISSQLKILQDHPELGGIIERLLAYLDRGPGPDPKKLFESPASTLRNMLKSDVIRYKAEPKG